MLLAAWAAVALAAAPPGIRVEAADEGRHRVSVVGLDAAQRGLVQAPDARPPALAVYAGAVAHDTPAMAGTYELDAEGLHFAPLFRFSPGVAYTARARIGSLRLERSFEVAASPQAPPEVRAVHPSGDALPANTLRLYLQFSRPMSVRDSTRHVHLQEADGREVPLAFVDVEGGLWDPERTRLTLFFHPGRVKRGVAPGERMGPPLRAGHAYRVVVDAGMTDAAGIPLGTPFGHSFTAIGPDRDPPRADGLTLAPPEGPQGPLSLRLPEPLDHALLQRWIWIEDAEGARVPGRIEVADAETRWVFTPDLPWSAGSYEVRIEPGLEDRAGNRFDRAFDRAPDAPSTSGAGPLRLSFAVR